VKRCYDSHAHDQDFLCLSKLTGATLVPLRSTALADPIPDRVALAQGRQCREVRSYDKAPDRALEMAVDEDEDQDDDTVAPYAQRLTKKRSHGSRRKQYGQRLLL